MKKLFSLLLLLCLIVTLTACGSDSSSSDKKEEKQEEKKSPIKTLTCSVEETESEIDFSSTIIFNYDEDKKEYTDAYMTVTVDYKNLLTEEELKAEIGDEEIKCETETMEEYFSSCKAKLEGTKYTQDATIDLSKFDEYDLKENDTLEKLKATIEKDEDINERLTCTIK